VHPQWLARDLQFWQLFQAATKVCIPYSSSHRNFRACLVSAGGADDDAVACVAWRSPNAIRMTIVALSYFARSVLFVVKGWSQIAIAGLLEAGLL